METMLTSAPDAANTGAPILDANYADEEDFGKCIDDIHQKVDQLEHKVAEVEQFYTNKDGCQLNASKCASAGKDKAKEKHASSSAEKHYLDASAGKRMQELMRQFATIFRQITQHKWAWPFMQPVDVEGLKLHDYYKVIKKPMDLGTIRTKMEAKDGSGYNNVREIYADVRLVFKNAMTYNDERDDVHVMAKTLLEKFEEKWLQLLPKVAEEEKRQSEEEAEARLNMQLAQEVAHADMARELSNELFEIDRQLQRLRESVVQKCRKMSIEEKKRLSRALAKLEHDDLRTALDMIAENDPSFPVTAPEVELDIDTQNDVTLWRLKVFVRETLRAASKNAKGTNGNNNPNVETKNNSKRRKEISDALHKTAAKRNKKSLPTQ